MEQSHNLAAKAESNISRFVYFQTNTVGPHKKREKKHHSVRKETGSQSLEICPRENKFKQNLDLNNEK